MARRIGRALVTLLVPLAGLALIDAGALERAHLSSAYAALPQMIEEPSPASEVHATPATPAPAPRVLAPRPRVTAHQERLAIARADRSDRDPAPTPAPTPQPEEPSAPQQVQTQTEPPVPTPEPEPEQQRAEPEPQPEPEPEATPEAEAGPAAANVAEGKATYYGRTFDGERTACGQVFDSGGLTAAHRTLPCGTQVTVTNLANGRSVTVTITDRGPVDRSLIVDLSRAAFDEIASLSTGVIRDRLEW